MPMRHLLYNLSPKSDLQAYLVCKSLISLEQTERFAGNDRDM